MGKKTLEKLKEIEMKEMKFKNAFQSHSVSNKVKISKIKENAEIPLINYVTTDLLKFKVRNHEDFKSKFKTDDVEKKYVAFMRHLFCKYKVPKFFDKVIKENIRLKTDSRAANITHKINENENILKWFICLGTGGSLYKEYFKEFLTKKETHIFSTCIYDEFNVNQVITYAIAYAESGDVGLSKRLALSNFSNKNNRSVFWKNCIKFFSNKENIPENIGKMNDLIDYLEYEKTQNNEFNIFGGGFTLQSLNKRMIDWHHELRRAKDFGNFTWIGSNVNDFEFIRNENKINAEHFTITQIKNSKELLNEGRVQHHCVFSYKNRCISGKTSIWSLSLNGKKKVTIEMIDKRIVQARGFANRMTRGDEDFIISKWCNLNNINYNVRY